MEVGSGAREALILCYRYARKANRETNEGVLQMITPGSQKAKQFQFKSGKAARMSPRERLIRALRRDAPDKVPGCARFTPAMMRIFNDAVDAGIPDHHLDIYGVGSGFILDVSPDYLTPDQYFGWEMRNVAFRPSGEIGDFSRYHSELPPRSKMNEWGVVFVPGEFHHYTRRIGPLRNMNSPAELKAFDFPDPMQIECHEKLDEEVESIHRSGLAAAGFMQQTLFELAWEMRGLDRLLIDFMDNRPFAEFLLDKITSIRCAMAARYAKAGVDLLRLGDDLGTQSSLMMSPSRFALSSRRRVIFSSLPARASSSLVTFFSSFWKRSLISSRAWATSFSLNEPVFLWRWPPVMAPECSHKSPSSVTILVVPKIGRAHV